MQIEYLADHLHFAPALARWHYDEWHELMPQWSYEEALTELQSHTRRACIPTTFVALAGSQLLGSASLIVDDLDLTRQLTPWLASVFVIPEQRGKGVGKKLVERVAAEAKQLNVATLYLFTGGQESFYRKLGWTVLQPCDCYGHAITIMCRRLADGPENHCRF